jgi:hypothetical protein
LVEALVFSQSRPAFVNLVEVSIAFRYTRDKKNELFPRLIGNLSITPAVKKLHLEYIHISLVDMDNIHFRLSHLEDFSVWGAKFLDNDEYYTRDENVLELKL